MKLGLFLGQLGLRGTDQFVYRLADVCESLLGHQAVLITHERQVLSKDVTADSQDMFRSRFFTVFKRSHECLDEVAQRYGLDVVYVSKWGIPDDLITTKVPCIVHAIFRCGWPHGTVYVAISEYMRMVCGAACGVLPFIVELLPPVTSVRRRLGIPDDAFVFGRHGGYDQFDVDFVHEAVEAFARPDVFFLFLNTRPFTESKNVLFLPGDPSLQGRSDFVASCDAMVHGRSDGETFGLACGEFSAANKPVLTTNRGDLAHVHILQPHVYVASDKEQYMRNMEAVMRLSGPQEFDAYRRFDRAAIAATFRTLIDKATV